MTVFKTNKCTDRYSKSNFVQNIPLVTGDNLVGYEPNLCMCGPTRTDTHIGFALLPATVSKQLSLLLNKAFSNHHHPRLLLIG